MSSNLKIELSDSNPILSEIFVNNSKDIVNPLLPFALHIKGNILICTERCGQKFSNTDIKVNIMKNYGKILMLKPSDDKSELTIFHDSRNDDTDNEGNGKYKLKYICFSCPSLIKIGNDDSDMQSYLIYSNDKGLYSVVCTLYNSSTAEVDPLPNALLSSLLTNNNIPELYRSKGGLSVNDIDITHFFPQNNKEYYEFINSDENQNKKDILVKVFRKKVNISSNIIETLKQKLYNPKSNDNYTNFKNGVLQLYDNKPKKINIFYIPNIELAYSNSNEKMTNFDNNDSISEENEVEEENIPLITRLKKSSLEKKEEETFIDFTDTTKIYNINIEDGSIKKDNNDKELIYDNLQSLLANNKDFNEDERRAVREFPNYIYKNSYWRLEYKIRLYQIKNDDTDSTVSDDDENFTIIDVNSIDDVKNKVGYNPTNKDIFYALKNFPNYGLPDKDGNQNKYYVSYYYPKSESGSQYVTIMYIFLCWLMILANYIFYRLIFFSINKDYGDISIDDDEITTNDKYKQLAAYRLFINILFVVQIIITMIYSIGTISGIVDTNSNGAYNYIYPILLVITLISTLYYGYKRLYFSKEEVSYAESKSLKLLLDSESDNDNVSKIVGWFQNSKDVLSYLYLPGENDGSNTSDLYDKIKDLKDKIDSINFESSTNIDKSDDLIKKADDILSNLEKIVDDNTNNKTKSRAGKYFSQIWNSLNNSINTLSGKTESKDLKKRATNLIKSMKNLAKENNQTGGYNTPVVLPKNSNKNSNKNVPIITGLHKDSTSNNNNDEFSSSNIDGKEYFPNLNNLSENNTGDTENGEWYDNLLECLTIRNIFLFIVFYVIFMYIYNKINTIINTFDLTDGHIYKNASSNITYPSIIVYLVINIILIGLYSYEKIIKYYFFAEENVEKEKEKVKKSNKFKYIISGLIFLSITWILFKYVGDDEWGKAYYYTLLSLGLTYIIYQIKETQDWKNWKKWLGFVLFIIFYFIGPYSNTTIAYKLSLTFAAVYLLLLDKYLLNNEKEPNQELAGFNNPVTLPINNFPKSEDVPMSSFIPSEDALKQISDTLEKVNNAGGKIQDKKKNLTESINVLSNLKQHYEKIKDKKHIELIENMIKQIEDIRDLK